MRFVQRPNNVSRFVSDEQDYSRMQFFFVEVRLELGVWVRTLNVSFSYCTPPCPAYSPP